MHARWPTVSNHSEPAVKSRLVASIARAHFWSPRFPVFTGKSFRLSRQRYGSGFRVGRS